jgi:Tol biopolymer transport system component
MKSSTLVRGTILALCLTASVAAAATELVSIDVGGAPAGGVGLNHNPGSTADVSPNGRFVLFTSTAADLVTGVTDVNGAADVFLRDLAAGTTVILSVDAAGNALGTTGNDALAGFVFSPNSRWLLFRTQADDIVAGLADTNVSPDWFVRDLLAGTTACVTVNADGTATGNSTSFTSEPPVFSPDSGSLAFISIAGNLVAGVTDPAGRDLFIRDLDVGTTSLVSVTTSGGASGLTTDDPAEFSPDGRYLAFLDMSPNLVDGVADTNLFTDLFVRDLATDTTYLVTRNVDDTAAQFSASYEWTSDSAAIVFESPGTALVAGLTEANLGNDTFRWDVATQTVEGVSVDAAGASTGNQPSTLEDVSPGGRYVAFSSSSTNLTPESAGGDVRRDLYVRDVVAGTTRYVSRNDSPSVALALVRFSPDGDDLFYASVAADEVAGVADTNGKPDLFVYELAGGDKSVVTINATGTATGDTLSTSMDDVVISPNGRYVSFVSAAIDLVPDFTSSSTRELFVRDVVAGVTRLVTGGLQGEGVGYDQGATRDAEFSPDDRFLVFTDNALLASQVTTPFNFNFATNLYAFDVVSGDQNLLTVNAAGTAPANGGLAGPFESGVEPFSFIVNPAGESVFFVSTSTDMVAGVSDTSATSDYFVADLPEPGPTPGECADPITDVSSAADLAATSALVTASDALFILRAGIGLATCELCVCDVDDSGTISATDALVTLKAAVGQDVELACPAC